jgi:rhamnose utilization protein RhaD (predicted bifunctional aldolase and dehydrogenase)
VFGGQKVEALPAPSARHRRQTDASLRGKISKDEYKLGHFDDSAAVLEFVCSADLAPLAALGTSCPDHFLRTKIRPLVLDFDPAAPDFDRLVAGLEARWSNTAPTTPPTTSAASAPTARKCATPTRSST